MADSSSERGFQFNATAAGCDSGNAKFTDRCTPGLVVFFPVARGDEKWEYRPWGAWNAADGRGSMTNIPTDLLRTFVLVVELRSFTRAAKAQGMTQPAVSAQIRRLQYLLSVELFDKSAPGVSLTPVGEQVIESARRLLSVNDHIVQIASPHATSQLLRIGIPGDCMGAELENLLVASRTRWPKLRFVVQGGGQRRLFQQLKQDEIDLVLALVTDAPEDTARHYWREELIWAGAKTTRIAPDVPVPLISYRDGCICHRVATAALEKVGRTAELVFRASAAEALRGAAAVGCGVMVVPRGRVPAELEAIDDGSLPPLPPVFCGVFVREGTDNATRHELADHLAQTLRPAAAAAQPLRFAAKRAASAEAVWPQA
jgi:DNA-binding transcriptional LysR family regulator